MSSKEQMDNQPKGLWEHLIGWFIENRLIVFLLTAMLMGSGLYVSPFNFEERLPEAFQNLPRDPVPVDAIPDIGENQQIIFSEWPGRSPRDIEDQVTYPLTTALLGIPGVRTVRSSSAFGFSTIYVIFNDEVEFYWSRSRVLEKLSSLSPGTIPDGVAPTLGPDATALGQIFWYTLEGQDPDGNTVGGWDPDELRSIQDWTVRYALQSVEGVSEVASVGGFVREYQVDVDPEAMRAHGVTLAEIANAVRNSNLDVGARTLEINGVEYMVRGLGFVKELSDLESTVVVTRQHTPIRIRDVGRVSLGPALRRGALDDEGAPAVGGVVVARFMENPPQVIDAVKKKIQEIGPGLPKRVLGDGRQSQVRIVPFYDRTQLIDETLETLSTALYQEILITILVVLVLLRNLRSSLLISALLPLGVLSAFGLMKVSGVDANIMALGGIAIAIGTMVDIGIVFVENIKRHLDEDTEVRKNSPGQLTTTVRKATAEVAPAVTTSVLTTIVSFLPVFGLSSTELRLFAPLAFTKTFAMGAALLISICILPGASLLLFHRYQGRAAREKAIGETSSFWFLLRPWLPRARDLLILGLIAYLLSQSWLPLGPGPGPIINLLFVVLLLVGVLTTFFLFERAYPRLLAAILKNKIAFLILPLSVFIFGTTAWLGFDTTFRFLPESAKESEQADSFSTAFPGFGREYMPTFDEGSYLYMPSTMPHASIAEALDLLSASDAAISAIPEVDRVVGKIGRAESALDPAPLSMIETVVTYKKEYGINEDGHRVRQWRDHIHSPRDIWNEILKAAERPGLTSAPLLMPIGARLVMLQSGMRAPMGIKVRGPSLDAIQSFGIELEKILKDVPAVRSETVFADRVVGKPYLEIQLNREAIGRFGLSIVDVQQVLQVALGGMTLTRTVEGRERYPVRVRYMREERDSLEALERILVPTKHGEQIPLLQLASIQYARGPQVIKSEDTFLTSYVLFDRRPEFAEVDTVEDARRVIQKRIESGELAVPSGVSFEFSGSYENQLRSEQRLMILIPIALAFVFILLYLQFHRIAISIIIYSGVAVAISGGFALMWLYAQPWFLDFEIFGTAMRSLFQVNPINLSVAVWIGFIALVGIATDDGVVISTYLKQRFESAPPKTLSEVHQRTIEAGIRRVRACLMTTATTILALLPIITSQGRGSDIMIPMALPSVGGMAIALMTLFVVPVLFCAIEEWKLRRR